MGVDSAAAPFTGVSLKVLFDVGLGDFGALAQHDGVSILTEGVPGGAVQRNPAWAPTSFQRAV